MPHSEVNYEDMIKVLEKMHTYVPSKDVEREFKIPNEEGPDSSIKVNDKKFTTLLVGGDQLTVARIHGVQMIRGNSVTSEERFEGLLPVAEDWHAKVCLLEVRIAYNYRDTIQEKLFKNFSLSTTTTTIVGCVSMRLV